MKKQNSSQPKDNFVSQPSSERKFNPPSRDVSHAEIYAKKLGNILNDINGILLEKEIEQVAANQINNLKKSHQQMMNVSENHYKESMDKFENIGEKMLNKFESSLLHIQQEINKSNQKFNKQLKQSMMSSMMQSMREMSKNLINQFRQQTKQVRMQELNNNNNNQPSPPTTSQNTAIPNQGIQSLKQIILQTNADMNSYFQQNLKILSENNSSLQTLLFNRKQKRKNISAFQLNYSYDSPVAVSQLKKYITMMLTEIASISFNLYFTEKLQFEKVKCYFCENFLLNVIKLVDKMGFSHIAIQIIDTHLSKLALPFLKHSYPHSEEKQVSRQLLKRIENKDIFNENRFDILENSKVKMTWHGKDVKDRDIYDTQREIMKVLNYIIDLPDTPLDSDGSPITFYQQFEEDMGNVFSKIYDKEFIEKMYKLNSKQKELFCEKIKQEKYLKEKKRTLDTFQLGQSLFMKKYLSESQFQQTNRKIKSENDDQQYRQKVQAYTKYKIGRKISANSKKYDTTEIEEGKLTIKDSGIMRVLTKWVESILQDFRSPQKATTEKDEPHRLFQGGQLEWQDGIDKKYLYNQFVKKSGKIFQQLGTLKTNLFQFILLAIQSHKKKQEKYQCSENQGIVGHVSSLVSKANQNYIINEINKLIQHIKLIQSIYATEINKGKKVMLVNMKLGDLMRCQITSKQKQIIAVYEYLCLLCQMNPEVFQLVRVKNRFDGPNKDIMVNIFYRQKIMIQVQLAIKNDSAFIECSDKYSHFIYELSRNFLGPLSEICNVWNKYSPTADAFNKRIVQNQKSGRDLLEVQNLPCIKHPLMANGQVFYLPFWCGNCGKFQNQFFKASLCKQCNHKICKYCTNLIKNQTKFQNRKRQTKINPFSTKCYLIFNYISTRLKNMVIIEILTKSHIFTFDMHKEGLEIMISNINMELEFTEHTKQKQKQQFVELNFIEKTDIKCDQEIISQILIKWWLKQKLKSINKLKKKRIQFLVTTNPIIDMQKFNTRLMKAAFEQQNMNKMCSLQRVSFFVAKIQKLPQRFKQMKKLKSFIAIKTKIEYIELPTNKLKELNLMENQIKDLSNIVHLSQSSQLERLHLSSNKLEDIETFQQHKLNSLKELYLANNKIISPKGIQNLKKLEKLILSQNKLLNLCSVNELTKLKELILVNCELKCLLQLKNLTNLQVLQVRQNNLNSLQGIQGCQKLSKIDASRNQISDLGPLLNMNSLKFLNLKENNFQTLKNMPQLKNLQYLGLQSNHLTSPEMFEKQLPKLKYLILKNNKINSLQWLTNCQIIQQLSLQQNEIPQILISQPIPSLKILKLAKNQINKIDGLNYFANLDILDLSNNEIVGTVDFPILVNLRLLLLDDNKIQFISLPNLQKLVKLYVSNNQIVSIEGISKSTNLQKLFLQNNKIEDLKGIQNLLNLTQLNIVDNKIGQIFNLVVCENIQKLNITLNGDLQKWVIVNKLKKLTALNDKIIKKSKSLGQKYVYQSSPSQKNSFTKYTISTKAQLAGNTRSMVGGSYVQQQYKTENLNQLRTSIPPKPTDEQKNNEKYYSPKILEKSSQQSQQSTKIQYLYRKYMSKSIKDFQDFYSKIDEEVDKQKQLYIDILNNLVQLDLNLNQMTQINIRWFNALIARKIKEKNGSQQELKLQYTFQYIQDEIRKIYNFPSFEQMPFTLIIKGFLFAWSTCKKIKKILQCCNQSLQRQKQDHEIDRDQIQCNLYIEIFELLFIQKNNLTPPQNQILKLPQNDDNQGNGERVQLQMKNTAYFGGAR